MAEYLKAGHRRLTPTRRGKRNERGRYTRNLLVAPAGRIECSGGLAYSSLHNIGPVETGVGINALLVHTGAMRILL